MTPYGERRDPSTEGAQRRVHGGFTHDGHWFTSETPVRGALTEFVRRAIRRRQDGATPADVILSLAAESAEVRAVFVPVAAQWSALTHFDQWGSAHTANSAQEAIKRGGAGA